MLAPMAKPLDLHWSLYWLLAKRGMHCYDASSTGEILAVLSIIMLDKAGGPVTSGELAEFTGLPRANVSRYAARQIEAGYLEEVVDPKDRRRRLLRVTAKGRREQQAHAKELSEFIARLGTVRNNRIYGDRSIENLVDMLSTATRHDA